MLFHVYIIRASRRSQATPHHLPSKPEGMARAAREFARGVFDTGTGVRMVAFHAADGSGVHLLMRPSDVGLALPLSVPGPADPWADGVRAARPSVSMGRGAADDKTV